MKKGPLMRARWGGLAPALPFAALPDLPDPCYLLQLSFSVVTRLNTGFPGAESTRSATK